MRDVPNVEKQADKVQDKETGNTKRAAPRKLPPPKIAIVCLLAP
jgi:hypothetical protein